MKLTRTALRLLAVSSMSLALACSAGEVGDSPEQIEADQTSSTASVRFTADFSETVDGTLRQGGTLLVDYDPARLPQCRDGANDGSAGWTITGFAKQGDAVKSFYVAGHASDSRIDENDPPKATIELERAGEIELWFQVTGLSGCNGYDSNEGANYRFDVKASDVAPASIVYGAEGGPSVEGRLVKGGSVRIEYDRSRLKECSMQAGVYLAYELGGDSKKYVDVKSGAGTIQLTKSGTLSMWFETNDQYGCHDTDSNGGANYSFDVEN